MNVHVPQMYTGIFWLFCLLIGVIVGATAIGMGFFVSYLFKGVFHALVLQLVGSDTFQIIEIFLFALYNLVVVMVGAGLVVCIAPLASGSGIPNMYAYLNGVEMPAFLTLRVAVVKIVASVLVVSGGLVIGKEGPLLHIGSIVATFLGGTRLFKSLQKTKDQDPFTYEQHARDLVACGAAAGLAAGFKAPVGGMLFAYEMASRWRPELTWRTLFTCAVVASVVKFGLELKTCNSFLSYGSLLDFSGGIDFPVPVNQVVLVAILGVLGGMVGCMFTSLNIHIGGLRWRYKSFLMMRVLEAGLVSLVTSVLRLSLPFLGKCIDSSSSCTPTKDCVSLAPGAKDLHSFQFYGCPNGTYNDLAVLMFNPQGFVVKALFTTKDGGFGEWSLALFFLFYFIMAVVSYGMAIPAGLFTPSVIIGGAMGQLYAHTLNRFFGFKLNPGLYAYLGAGSVLAGLFRFAVSFVVILTELTSTEEQLPLLMIVVIIAKGIGDRFNQNILNHLCILMGFPYVGSHPESTIKRKGFTAKDVMVRSTTCLCIKERRSVIMEALSSNDSTVFPVVSDQDSPSAYFMGMVKKSDIEKLMEEISESTKELDEKAELLVAVDRYLESGEEEDEVIDLSSITTLPPVVIPPGMPLTSVYRLKKSTGLEYIPVIDQHGPLQGMITRDVLLQCQNQLIDPNHLQEDMDKWTDEAYGDRAIYEHALGNASVQIRGLRQEVSDLVQPVRRANTVL